MKRTPFRLILCILGSFFLWGCGNRDREHIQGYIDAQLAYVSSPKAGKLIRLNVNKGDKVDVEEILFELEEEPEKSALDEAIKRVEENKARLLNAEKGQRPTEIAALESRIVQAEARHDLAKIMFDRQTRLFKEKAVERAAVDQAKRELDESEALTKELKSNLETAQLGARVDEINAAKAQLAQSEAELRRVQWEYDQKIVKSWVNASVFDKYFEIGENVAAYRPVLSLVIPEEVKAIFFVPERQLSQLRIGQKVKVICDNCKEDIIGTIRFISPQAEYTPPVIYSKERRSELVFRVEAKFDLETAVKMHLGLPIEVKLLDE